MKKGQQDGSTVVTQPKETFETLADELVLSIFQFLGFREWVAIARVCKDFRNAARDSVLSSCNYPVVPKIDDVYKSHQLWSRAADDYKNTTILSVHEKDQWIKALGDIESANGYIMWECCDELRGDREFVLEAVSQDGNALGYASDELRTDRKFVLEAVSRNCWALQYASYELRADRDIVLAAVSRNCWALWYVSEELAADYGIVLAAVSQNDFALNYRSFELRADRDIVLAAVSQNGDALRFVSDELKGDREIVLAAARGTLSSCELTANRLGLFAVSIGALTGLGMILSYQYGDDNDSRLEL